MSSKRSFQQREEEPWLRYPDPLTTSRDYRRSSAASYYKHQSTASFDLNRLDHLDQHSFQVQSMPQQQPHRTTAETTSPLTTPTMIHMRTISRTGASSPSNDQGFRFTQTNYRSSFSSRRGTQTRTLSEELSMALQQSPEDNYPSPTTPSGFLSSPADVSMLSSSGSSSPTLSSTGHFPLFKPSLSGPHNTIGSGGQPKPRPSPLSLDHSNSHGQEGVAGENPSFPFHSGSPTSDVSRETTTAARSPRAAFTDEAANLGSSSPLPRSNLRHSRGIMSPATSISGSSYYSSASSPRALTAPCSSLCHRRSSSSYHQHHPSCLHSQSNHHNHGQHHPACQHHTALPQSQQEHPLQHGPKPGRATKGINRFGMPKFRPEMDDSHPGSSEKYTPMKTTSTSTSGSGYGMLRNRDDDDDDMDGLGSSEPPKKRQRSMSLMLLDAAVETVIFTGAVALSAYQLLTGKSKLGSHSKQSSMTSEDADAIVREGNAKTLDEDPMEEKLSWVSYFLEAGLHCLATCTCTRGTGDCCCFVDLTDLICGSTCLRGNVQDANSTRFVARWESEIQSHSQSIYSFGL
ncbi:hypothetical protein EDD21DRAFT_389518 [Dissophora ornata]|nr:hypothetical protein EDD21DRAFT_389518 [Dissophora ornata]